LEIPRGKGVLKAKVLEAKYETKLEFLGGGGAKQNFHGWEYGYFLDLNNWFFPDFTLKSNNV